VWGSLSVPGLYAALRGRREGSDENEGEGEGDGEGERKSERGREREAFSRLLDTPHIHTLTHTHRSGCRA
jgi:hypothetical protein